MEFQEDSKRKRRSSSKEFRLKVKYYRDNMKNNNKTATHFHVDRKQVSAFLTYTIFFNNQLHFSFQPRVAKEKLEIEPQSC